MNRDIAFGMALLFSFGAGNVAVVLLVVYLTKRRINVTRFIRGALEGDPTLELCIREALPPCPYCHGSPYCPPHVPLYLPPEEP